MKFSLIFEKRLVYVKEISAKDYEAAQEKAERILERQHENENTAWDLHSECDGWELSEIQEE